MSSHDTTGVVIDYGFPPEIAPSEALLDIAAAFREQGEEIMSPVERIIFAATLRSIAARVQHFELCLGIFHNRVIYDAINENERPLLPIWGHHE